MAVPIRNRKVVLRNGYVPLRKHTAHSWDRATYWKAREYVTAAHDPVYVYGVGDADDPEMYSNGELPTTSTYLIIMPQAHLTVPDGADWRFFRGLCWGDLDINGGTEGAVTNVVWDMLICMPTGNVRFNGENGERIDHWIPVDGDIDVESDPELWSRSCFNLGSWTMRGKKRQRYIPFAVDPSAGATNLTLGRNVFLGRNGRSGAANDEFNYSSFDFDWPVGEKIIIPPTTIGSSRAGGFDDEIAQIASVTPVVNSTVFSEKDTTGLGLGLTSPLVASHPRYWDAPAIDFVIANFGPPLPAPTHGSHVFAGRGGAANANSNIRCLMGTPEAPQIDGKTADDVAPHRRPLIYTASSATDIEAVEFRGWGRTDMRALTVRPGSVPHEADTNLRYRHAIQAIDAGYTRRRNYREGKKCVRVAHCSIWGGGAVGKTIANDEIGTGSYSCFVSAHRCAIYVEGNLAHNTIGSPFFFSDPSTIGDCRHNVGIASWSMNPTGPGVFFKDHTHYTDGDVGRDGSIYMSFSRAVEFTRNFAFGMAGPGRVVLTRSPDNNPNFDVRNLRQHPSQVRYHQHYDQPLDDDRIDLLAEGDHFMAGYGYGHVVSKNSPSQLHGYRSHIRFGLYINCRGSAQHYEYTAQYLVDRCAHLGCEDGGSIPPELGAVRYGNSTFGFVMHNCYFANYGRALSAQRRGPIETDPLWTVEEMDQFFVDNFPYRNVANDDFRIEPEEYVTLGGDYESDWGFHIDTIDTTSGVRFTGRYRDGLGETTYPFAGLADEQSFLFSATDTGGAVSAEGYWQNTDYPASGPPYFTATMLACTNRLPTSTPTTSDLPNHRTREVLFPLRLSAHPDASPLAKRWLYPSGRPIPYTFHGPASYSAMLAAANAAASGGIDFDQPWTPLAA